MLVAPTKMFHNWYRIWWSRNQLWNCMHFRHPTDEGLWQLDICKSHTSDCALSSLNRWKPKQGINTWQITEVSNSVKATCRLTLEAKNCLQHEIIVWELNIEWEQLFRTFLTIGDLDGNLTSAGQCKEPIIYSICSGQVCLVQVQKSLLLDNISVRT